MMADSGSYGANRGSTTAAGVADILQLVVRREEGRAAIHPELAAVFSEHADQFGYMAVQKQNHGLAWWTFSDCTSSDDGG